MTKVDAAFLNIILKTLHNSIQYSENIHYYSYNTMYESSSAAVDSSSICIHFAW